MPAKFKRCVKEVERKNEETGYKGNPYAICRKSTGFKGSTHHRRRTRKSRR